MSSNLLIITDVVCIPLMIIHLYDVDLALKLCASVSVLTVNAIVLYKHFKNK